MSWPLLLELVFARSDGTQLALDGVLYAIRTGRVNDGEATAGLQVRPSAGLMVRSELLTAHRRLVERVAGQHELQGSLLDLAAFAERVLPGESFCMITPVSSGGLLEKGVAPKLPEDVTVLHVGHRVGEAFSPASVAAGSGQPLIATDLSVETGWSRFADVVQRHGLVTVWSHPVRGGDDGEVLAVLDILLPMRRPPSRVESALLEELAGMVRLAMELHRLVVQLEARGLAQREAEAYAADRSRLLDAVVDTALDSVISIDSQGCITLWNRQAHALFGWTSEETLGQPLSRFIIPPHLVKAHEDGMARFRQTGFGPVLGKRIEIEARDRAGRQFWVELSINPTPGPGGGFSAFLRDISERRRIEKAVRDSEQRLKLIVDAAGDGFWDLRLDGGAPMVSDRCSLMLGLDPAQASWALPPDHPLVHPEDRDGVRDAWNAHLQGRSARYESEHRRRHADGSWRWIREWGKVVERGPSGEAARIVGTQSDVTERRSLEARVGSAERFESLGLLAGGFAQELDKVLAVIRAQLSLASVVADLPPRAAECLEVIQFAVAKARSMGQSLLHLGPGEGAGLRETARASDLVRETLQLMRPTLPRTVEVMLEDRSAGHDWVEVDRGRLQQSVINLLLHACESAVNAGRIVLRIETTASHRVIVSCIDPGPPWAPSTVASMFHALGPEGGVVDRTALGMASVRRFVESAQGRVSAGVSSEGNEIVIDLPAVMDPSRRDAMSVIVHQHHALLRPMLVEALLGEGHNVRVADDPGQLEGMLEAHPGSLLLLDDLAWDAVAGSAWPRWSQQAPQPSVVIMTDRMHVPGAPPGAAVLRQPFVWEQLS
ncbi:MAG: PAS domain S-box protein, partial [Planctomycetes bacterium]|nr:PAS domain S-box protein [Planctomycetota bacterium]